MSAKFVILVSMLFFHVVDDFYLQGWLASAKQKEWWEKNAPDKMYRFDYIVALLMHSFSWTFMIYLVPAGYIIIWGGNLYPLLFIGNILLHMFIDDLKANKKKINLIQDQAIHVLQVILTWVVLCIL
mgnify:CR=1 FL=1